MSYDDYDPEPERPEEAAELEVAQIPREALLFEPAPEEQRTTRHVPAGSVPLTPGFLRPLADIYKDLAKPLAEKRLLVKNVPGKGGKRGYRAVYVHHTMIRDVLDYYAPGWEWTTRLFSVDGKVYVQGTMTIVGSDGRVSRDGIGNEESDVDSFGDPSSNAEAQAIRRAGMAHGLCRNLWRK